jgi:hypothetical protein
VLLIIAEEEEGLVFYYWTTDRPSELMANIGWFVTNWGKNTVD